MPVDASRGAILPFRAKTRSRVAARLFRRHAPRRRRHCSLSARPPSRCCRHHTFYATRSPYAKQDGAIITSLSPPSRLICARAAVATRRRFLRRYVDTQIILSDDATPPVAAPSAALMTPTAHANPPMTLASGSDAVARCMMRENREMPADTTRRERLIRRARIDRRYAR